MYELILSSPTIKSSLQSMCNFNAHSGGSSSHTFLLYTVVLANRHWLPAYTPINWSILKTPITALPEKPVFAVNLYLDLINNLPPY